MSQRLIDSAKTVIDNWESGDLAEAVRELASALDEFQGQKHTIIVEMEGGLIQCVREIPANIQVEVRDFDIDGLLDEDLTVIDGEACNRTVWFHDLGEATVNAIPRERVYIAVHEHEYGASVHPFIWTGLDEPDQDTVVAELKIDFEPERAESLEIMPFDVREEIPRIPAEGPAEEAAEGPDSLNDKGDTQ